MTDWLGDLDAYRAEVEREAHEPLVFDRSVRAPSPDVLARMPADMRRRLEIRACAGGFVASDGTLLLACMMDAKLLRVGHGSITVALVDLVMKDPLDPDMGQLVRCFVSDLLEADGYPDAAAQLWAVK